VDSEIQGIKEQQECYDVTQILHAWLHGMFANIYSNVPGLFSNRLMDFFKFRGSRCRCLYL